MICTECTDAACADRTVNVRSGQVLGCCTACADRSRCHERFTCITCGREFNCCAHLPGWPDNVRQNECDRCEQIRILGEPVPKEPRKSVALDMFFVRVEQFQKRRERREG